MPRIPEPTRDAILADLQAETDSVRGIARTHNVSPSAVSNIARAHNITPSARARTKKATAARVADQKSARSQMAARLAGLASGIIGTLEDVTPAQWAAVPPNLRMVAVAIAVDKIEVLERDTSDGLAAVDLWLRSVGV